MKVKQTYSRKKLGKRAPSNVIFNINYNINIHNNVFNITNIHGAQGNQSKPETSESESGDAFDKLLKGPTYKTLHSTGLPDCSRRFFSQRQDTATFYKSDAELSVSNEFSRLLFKDSKDSDLYSPCTTPPEYCIVKNKVVKLKKNDLIPVSRKIPNRVEKKHQVARRKRQVNKIKSGWCTASTPTKSNALSNKGMWLDTTSVSPIMPPKYTLESSDDSECINATREIQSINKESSVHGVTALIEGLGNLGIKTPHHNKCSGMLYCKDQKQEQFDPFWVLNNNNKSEEPDHPQKSGTSTPFKVFGDEENRREMNLLQLDFSEVSTSETNFKLGEEVLNRLNSSVSTPQEKIFEEEENIGRSKPKPLKSPSHVLMSDNKHEFDQEDSASFVLSSPCSKALKDQEYLLVNNEEKCSWTKISSPVLLKEIGNEFMGKPDSRNSSLVLCKEINSDSSSDRKLKYGNTEPDQYNDNSDFDCSLPVVGDQSNQSSPEEIGDRNNLINIQREDMKSHICANDSQDSSFNDSLFEKSPVKVKLEEAKKSQRYKSHSEDSCFNKTYIKTSSVKELTIQVKGEDKKSLRTKEDPEENCLNESYLEKSPTEELKACDSQPLSELTNLASYTSNREETGEILKRSVPHNKENKRPGQNSMIKDSLSFLLNGKVNLETGKKWRRSLLRQKKTEARLDRRSSVATDTLVKLIKESSNLNDTKLSFNNTTLLTLRNTNSTLEDHEIKSNSSIPVLQGSPGFNISFSRLSKVHTRRRRNYVCDMHEIPEEISDHSNSKLTNEEEICEESLVQDQSIAACESVNDNNVDRTNIYETPPILKLNPEALSAITDRKRSRRYRPRSLDESTTYSDFEEKNETSDEENNLFTSCCSKLELEDDIDIENLNEEDIRLMGKLGFLVRCGQEGPMSFTEAFSERVLDSGQKIGEGVFGEVFMLERPGEGRSVIKIIPVEGSQLVNGEPQKRFDEVLSELIITEELSALRQDSSNYTSGYCELKRKLFLQGKYPPQLLRLWHEFDAKKRSDNECPDMFDSEQLYLTLELAHVGEPVETFRFKSPQQALAVFLQTTFSLAVAESAIEFEHRDLHIGNVLVQMSSERYISYKLNGDVFECPTYGTMATVIDYTLSRISFKGDVLYLDLEKDPELFTATEDYQFDIYRHMRADLNNNWRDHEPKTNVRWLHYLMVKLTSDQFKYKQKKSTKAYKEYMDKMVRLLPIILDFHSATDLAQHLVNSYSQTATLIKS